jgi:predicted alpha/beta hydrolase
MKKSFVAVLFIFFVANVLKAQEKITIPTADGIEITADAYIINNTGPFILLCHQADYSRGEYRQIAPELNKLGYNCIAIDQRSGNEVKRVTNQTAKAAKNNNLPTNYWDAKIDIENAIAYISTTYKPYSLILWGSSYSASLSLIIASQNDHVSGVIAFSPGEYFDDKTAVEKTLKNIKVTAFVTSSFEEAPEVINLVTAIRNKIIFTPTSGGRHGSSALWQKNKNNEEYWAALKNYLIEISK